MAAANKKPEAASLASLVRDAWDGGAPSMPAATKALFDRVSTDSDLMADLMRRLLWTWCSDQISDHVGRLRLKAAASVGFDESQRGSRLSSVIATTLFDFPLPGGKRLGDANANEVRDGAQAYAATADDAACKARWLEKVAARVGRKNSVEAALSLQQLEAIYQEARDGE